jgi:fatty-acyl-CoA synthase
MRAQLLSPLGRALKPSLAPALSTRCGLTFDHSRVIARSQRAAARLHHEWGVQPGDRVAYLGHNHPDVLCLLLACAEIGAVLVPLNYRLAAPELSAICAQCSPCIVLHDATYSEACRSIGTLSTRYLIDDLLATPAARLPLPAAPDASAAVLIVYTSGTTGAPKGAVHTQATLLANARAAVAAQSLTPADHVLTVLPLFHVGGLCIQTLPALLAGAHVTLASRFDAADWLADVQTLKPTLTLMVPATMRAVLEHPAWVSTNLSSLRAVWAGSSGIATELIERFHARGLPICAVYGATETGPVSLVQPPPHHLKIGSTGKPALGVEAQIRPQPSVQTGGQKTDDIGELWLRAPNIISHYWPARPALDANGWFATGDLARIDAEGDYWIVGRCKDMIISGGENIYPAEIENLLAQHPAIAEAAVVGLADAQWGEIVAAFIVLKAGQALSAELVLAYLYGKLAKYKLPKRVEFVASLPKTALGKVQKAALIERIN